MSRHIPLIEPVVDDAEFDRVRSVIESGYMTQGPVTAEFESGFADLVGATHAVTTTSCTTGMELALDALGVDDGEVVVPDFTYPATANAVVRVGADPVIVDVDRETYNIDPEATKEAISADTTAILPVSWGGQPLDPDPFLDLAADHDLAVLEDAACSVLAAYDDQYVGTQFDASVFSFHPRKVLTTGEGGMVTTDDDALEETMRQIKNFGTNPNTDVGFVRADATNFRLSDILAAVGVAQLEKIEEIVERRRAIAHRYDDLLADVDGVVPPLEVDGGRHNYQSYCVYIEAGDDDTRDHLIDDLAAADIESQIGTYALHRTEAFADATHVGSLDDSTALFHNLLTLPVAHSMTDADQQRVVDELDSALDAYR